MKIILTAILTIVIVTGLSTTLPPVYAATCPTPIMDDTILTEDCTGSIVIDADNIKLDCRNHTITGTGGGFGITLNGKTGVTIEKCKKG